MLHLGDQEKQGPLRKFKSCQKFSFFDTNSAFVQIICRSAQVPYAKFFGSLEASGLPFCVMSMMMTVCDSNWKARCFRNQLALRDTSTSSKYMNAITNAAAEYRSISITENEIEVSTYPPNDSTPKRVVTPEGKCWLASNDGREVTAEVGR